MLIQFNVENYKSIKKPATIDFRTARRFSQKTLPDNFKHLTDWDENVLRSIMVFGANASGKSNLLLAIEALTQLVRNSAQFKGGHAISLYHPFSLTIEDPSPTKFEIEFIAADKLRYIYSISYDERSICNEKLFVYGGSSRKRKNLIYQRFKNKEIKFGPTYRGTKVFNLHDNQLVLSQAGISPIAVLEPVYRFFETSVFCYTFHDDGLENEFMHNLTNRLHHTTEADIFVENINKILRAADTSIDGITVNGQVEPTVLNLLNGRKLPIFKDRRIKTKHRIYDEDSNLIGLKEFDLADESAGTQKLIIVAAIVLNALETGQLLVFDEIDKSLHPHLTRMIIGLFNNSEINKNGAQLFMATHDATIIDKELFRQDQIVITDKEYAGSSAYKKMSSFTGVSKAANLDDWYLLGVFGGVPMINEFELDLTINEAA